MKGFLAASLLMAPLAYVLAQDTDPPKEVKDLAWMVGSWSGKGQIAFGGHEVEITSKITASFDGQFLKTTSTDKSSGSTLTKTTMTGWDPAKNEFVSYTFTNMAPTARIAHGKLDGGKLVMVSEPWKAEGMTTVSRETMWRVSDSKWGLTIEFKQGDKWIKGMDFTLEKQ